MVGTSVLLYCGRPRLGLIIKTNIITFQTVNTEIYLILIFHESVSNSLLRHILCMIFQEKYFSSYIQILWSG